MTQNIYTSFLALLLAIASFAERAYASSTVLRNSVELLEPLGSMTSVPIVGGAPAGTGTWLIYFQSAAPWLYDVAIGICVLWCLFAGIMIIIAGEDQKVSEAQGKMVAAIGGLVILTFAPVILRTLNSMFFV